MKPIRYSALALAISLISFSAVAKTQTMRPANADDLVATRVVSADLSKATAGLDRQAAQFSWVLQDQTPIERAKAFVAESREYWFNASAEQLRNGVSINLNASGAVVRLSPALREGENAKALALSQVRVSQHGKAIDQAIAVGADAKQMASAGALFGEGTIAFRLSDSVTTGTAKLSLGQAQSDYLVHVFEPNSNAVLAFGADRHIAVDGGKLELVAEWRHPGHDTSIEKLTGMVTAPNGETSAVTFIAGKDGRHRAQLTTKAIYAGNQGLWEAQVFASASNGKLQRDAKTAFTISTPTARLTGNVSAAKKRGSSLDRSLEVEVATPSRYEVRGVLYATNLEGELVPVMMAHSAAFLSPGLQTMDLGFDLKALAGKGFKAPYEIRHIELHNQANQDLIETREAGFALQ